MKRMLGLAVAAVIFPACIGPIDYLHTVAIKARRGVAEAEAVEAKTHSPYEYWSAVTYLHMAREKAALADFQDANKYGRRAEEMAALAKKRSVEQATRHKGATLIVNPAPAENEE